MNILTPGLNWYLNRHVRMEFNYGLADIDGGPSDGTLHIFQTRLSIYF